MNQNEQLEEMRQLEATLQNLLVKKQNLQSQLKEINDAIKSLDSSKEAYKIIGNIMVKKDKKSLTEESRSKKESIELKIKNIEKHQESLNSRMKKLQEKIIKNIKKTQ